MTGRNFYSSMGLPIYRGLNYDDSNAWIFDLLLKQFVSGIDTQFAPSFVQTSPERAGG